MVGTRGRVFIAQNILKFQVKIQAAFQLKPNQYHQMQHEFLSQLLLRNNVHQLKMVNLP